MPHLRRSPRSPHLPPAIPTPTPEPILSLTPVPVAAVAESAITAASAISLTQTAELGAGTIRTVTLSADGQYLAIGGSLGVHLYQAAELNLFAFFRTDRAVQKVCFSADGEHVVVGFGEGVAPKAFNFRTGKPLTSVRACRRWLCRSVLGKARFRQVSLPRPTFEEAS